MNFILRSSFRRLPILLNLQHRYLMVPSAVRPVTLKIITQRRCDESPNHDERNMNLGRPMSPHLSIYKLPFSSKLSLSHRATGMWLMVYIWILSFGSHVVDLPYLIEYLQGVNFPAVFVIIMKFILSYPLSYHLINGLRHFSWDMGTFLSLNQIYTTGYAMLGLSCAASAFCALL